jgi:myo-inositol 2-dehydrogenase/D-chiro-inositol 1-dehydrogenase
MILRIGIIGAGVMGAGHARIIQASVAGAYLAAVYDADTDRAQAAAGDSRVMSDPHALINDPSIDAVIVASPDATHRDYVLDCIAAGKPVLCEKPLALTTAECLDIVAAEEKSGQRLVQVGFMRRFDPAYLEMKATLEAGTLGRPLVVHCQHRNASAPEWFTSMMAITNSFVHEIDICRWLLGAEFTTARVFPCKAGANGETYDPLLILLETESGQIVSSEVFMNAGYGYHVHAEAVCSSGTIGLAQPALTRSRHSGSERADFPANWIPRFADAYRLQDQAWIDAIAKGTSVGASAWDGLVATCLSEQIVRALETGQMARLELPRHRQVAGGSR